MITGDAVWQGGLYKVDEDGGVEELLTAVEVTKTKGWIYVTWFWLTGPDAGTIFVGQPISFNQQISLSRVL